MNTPTPRTDAEKYYCVTIFDIGGYTDAIQKKGHRDSQCVSIDFACGLERELNEAKEKLAMQPSSTMDTEYSVIESVAGFCDTSTSVGECWEKVQSYIAGLERKAARAESAESTLSELMEVAERLAGALRNSHRTVVDDSAEIEALTDLARLKGEVK